MALTTVPVELASLDGAVTVNESSADADFRVESNGLSHALFVDGGNDKVIINHTTTVSQAGVAPQFQVHGTGSATSSISATRNSNDTGGPYLILSKSRGTSTGATTVVQDDDILGQIMFAGADGGDLAPVGASIQAFVDGTPGTNDMPGRLVFSTTVDGAQTATERMHIDNAGKVSINSAGASSPAPLQHFQVIHHSGGGRRSTLYYNQDDRIALGALNASSTWEALAIEGSLIDLKTGGTTNVSALNIDEYGHVRMPKQSSFLGTLGSTQSNISSETTVTFTEIADRNSDFSSSVFTAPVTGLYQLNCWLRLQDVPADISGYIIIRITVSNRNFDWIWTTTGFDATQTYLSTAQSVLVDMDANDTAYVVFHQSGGTTGSLDIGDGAFSGYLVA